MVVDKIGNLGMYEGLNKNIEYVKKFLETTDLMSLEVGRYDLENGCYYMVQEYLSRELADTRWEAHLKFVDLQFVVKGFEYIGYTDLDTLKVNIPYDAEKDAEYYDKDGNYTKLLLEEGYFCLLFPDDPHRACMKAETAVDVKKIVVKIPV